MRVLACEGTWHMGQQLTSCMMLFMCPYLSLLKYMVIVKLITMTVLGFSIQPVMRVMRWVQEVCWTGWHNHYKSPFAMYAQKCWVTHVCCCLFYSLYWCMNTPEIWSCWSASISHMDRSGEFGEKSDVSWVTSEFQKGCWLLNEHRMAHGVWWLYIATLGVMTDSAWSSFLGAMPHQWCHSTIVRQSVGDDCTALIHNYVLQETVRKWVLTLFKLVELLPMHPDIPNLESGTRNATQSTISDNDTMWVNTGFNVESAVPLTGWQMWHTHFKRDDMTHWCSLRLSGQKWSEISSMRVNYSVALLKVLCMVMPRHPL